MLVLMLFPPCSGAVVDGALQLVSLLVAREHFVAAWSFGARLGVDTARIKHVTRESIKQVRKVKTSRFV
jgi:hypothetical protein